jgi:hypothetical protein
MKLPIFILASTMLSIAAPAVDDMQPKKLQKLVDAIYLAEGGSRTKYPYGIKSVHTSNPRQVCFRTVNHAWRDWHSLPPGQASTQVDRPFILFLADRYCPASVDKQGNVNWKKNVSFFFFRK